MNILGLEKINAQFYKALYRITKKVVMHDPMVEIDKVTRFTTGTTITGFLTCGDNCHFDGTLNGDLDVGKKLVLDKNSKVFGDISATDLLAKGKITGSVKVNNKTVYCSTSTTTGPCCVTNVLVIEQGAVINLDSLSMQRIGVPCCMPAKGPGLNQRAFKKKKIIAEATLNITPELEARIEPKYNREDNIPADILLLQFFQNKDDVN